jgi:protein involved in temperature-dependent protein secretion
LPYLISKLTSELGDVEATIQHLRDAVEAKPSSADWRYELSRHLYDSGDKLAAIQQAKLCAKLAPSKKRYQEWLQNLERSTNASAPSQR